MSKSQSGNNHTQQEVVRKITESICEKHQIQQYLADIEQEIIAIESQQAKLADSIPQSSTCANSR